MGVAHPPTKYLAKDFAWERMATWRDAILQGLLATQVTASRAEISSVINEVATPAGRADVKKNPSSDVLYHPADRNTFMVFENEAEIAEICRRFDRDLIITTPEIRDRTQWPLIYNPKDVDRPATRMRWGLGTQGRFRPIYLGCLLYSDNAVEWYTLQPYGQANEESWKKLWTM